MLDNFWFNVEYGINHVLDINAYDHVLFLIVLAKNATQAFTILNLT